MQGHKDFIFTLPPDFKKPISKPFIYQDFYLIDNQIVIKKLVFPPLIEGHLLYLLLTSPYGLPSY